MNYSEINLFETLASGISEAGYVTCTPVQEQVLKISLDGSDLYVQSQTGTGKTAAFLVTIMQQLLSGGKSEGKNALVMVPTRELAVQVEEEAKKLGKNTGLKFVSIYGGVGYEEQIARLEKGVDIIIGTPGRVIDLKEQNKLDLTHVSYLAIDEADRMFDMGFYPDLRKILKFLPSSETRQTMLFSATLNTYVKNLAYEYTKDAKEVTIEAENITVDEIDQELIHVGSDDKIKLLMGIISREKPDSLIIFCNTKKYCEILSRRLDANGVKNEFIIGDLPQTKRLRIMNNFKSGKIKCLIATDVAARGIDVNDLAMVINYDLPNEAENYVHRIGRTARAGKKGKAYSFCGDTQEDAFNLMGIEKYIEKKIPYIVASSEDFGTDLSEGKNWNTEKRNRNDSKNFRSGRKSDKNDRNRKSGFNKKSSGFRSGERTSREELDRLSSMSADERREYFKQKYAGKFSFEQKTRKPYDRNNNRNGKKRNFDRKKNGGKPASSQVKKTGFFGRLFAMFTKKK